MPTRKARLIRARALRLRGIDSIWREETFLTLTFYLHLPESPRDMNETLFHRDDDIFVRYLIM